jgi:hypothetical protein
MPRTGRQKLLVLLCCFLLPQPTLPSSASDRDRIFEALDWVRSAPENSVQYNYVMTARVRLLFFWTGKDDVGEGYIRHGISKDDPREETIQVLFGSDPVKAPRAINRWGAGTEVQWHRSALSGFPTESSDDVVASAFFGFMKSSKGKSANEMQEELKKEGEGGEHLFTGIVSRVDSGQAVSTTVPLSSNTDYTLHEYENAEPIMYERLRTMDRPVRTLGGGASCDHKRQFLGTVSELINYALAGKKAGQSLCYAYDSKLHTLTLERAETIRSVAVKVRATNGQAILEKTYDELLETDFVSSEAATGNKSSFSILLGTQGALRGVPVQIRYQPNWWFQVVLNLRPDGAEGGSDLKAMHSARNRAVSP